MIAGLGVVRALNAIVEEVMVLFGSIQPVEELEAGFRILRGGGNRIQVLHIGVDHVRNVIAKSFNPLDLCAFNAVLLHRNAGCRVERLGRKHCAELSVIVLLLGVTVQDIRVDETGLIHLIVGVCVLLEFFGLIEGINRAVLTDEAETEGVLNIERIGIIASVEPVCRILILVEPSVSLHAGLVEDLVLRLLHEVDDVFRRVRELVVADLLSDVGTVVNVGHRVIEGSPVARYCVLFALVEGAQPLGLRELIVEVRVVLDGIVDGGDSAHACDSGKVLNVLHNMQQLFTGRQHEVQFLSISIPRDSCDGNLNVYAVFLQFLVDSSHTGLIVRAKCARLYNTHRVNGAVVLCCQRFVRCGSIGRSRSLRGSRRCAVSTGSVVVAGATCKSRNDHCSCQSHSQQFLRCLHFLLQLLEN